MVGGQDRLGIMLHDQDRIAQIPHGFQGFQEASVIAGMKTDTRLVEDVKNAGQFGADLSRKPYTLTFTAGKGAGATVKGQIGQAHVNDELQALLNFAKDFPGDGLFLSAEGEALYKGQGLGGAQRSKTGNGYFSDAHGTGMGI
jgi:hypothetical protein